MEHGKVCRFLKRLIRSLKADQRQAEWLEVREEELGNKRYWQGFQDGMGFAINEVEDLKEALKTYRRRP